MGDVDGDEFVDASHKPSPDPQAAIPVTAFRNPPTSRSGEGDDAVPFTPTQPAAPPSPAPVAAAAAAVDEYGHRPGRGIRSTDVDDLFSGAHSGGDDMALGSPTRRRAR